MAAPRLRLGYSPLHWGAARDGAHSSGGVPNAAAGATVDSAGWHAAVADRSLPEIGQQPAARCQGNASVGTHEGPARSTHGRHSSRDDRALTVPTRLSQHSIGAAHTTGREGCV